MEKFFEGHISKTAVSGNIAAASFSGRLNASSGKGSNDYENLSNKPRINGVILSGNKSFEELGFPDIPDMSGYAKLSDIPSSLPARGGDADTVGGHTVLTDVPENAVFTDTVPDMSGYARLADIPSSLPARGGDADTVGGHTVLADVPENAVFTDTVPDMSGYARLSDIPSSLPARGGDADTVGGRSYDEIKNTVGTNILTSPDTPTDLREWIYRFDSGIYVVQYDHSNIIFPANVANGSSDRYFIIDWKRRYSNDLGGIRCYYGILTLRSMQNNRVNYICTVYNDTKHSEWQNIFSASGFAVSGTSTAATDNFVTVKFGFKPTLVLYNVYLSNDAASNNGYAYSAAGFNENGFYTNHRVGAPSGTQEIFSYMAFR